MKAICCLLLLLGSPLALGQGAPPPLDISNPESYGTKGACLAECERVFADCKVQCENTSARAHERHFETPDLPVGECIKGCQVNLRLCKEDC
jgi:hypothetical protein